jgi:hypothetical protein
VGLACDIGELGDDNTADYFRMNEPFKRVAVNKPVHGE